MSWQVNGKRAEINNISKHVVICSSRLFVLLYFSFYCCSIASPRSAWHCIACAPRAPLARALRALQAVIQVEPKLAPKRHPINLKDQCQKYSKFKWALGPSWIPHFWIFVEFSCQLRSQNPSKTVPKRCLRWKGRKMENHALAAARAWFLRSEGPQNRIKN